MSSHNWKTFCIWLNFVFILNPCFVGGLFFCLLFWIFTKKNPVLKKYIHRSCLYLAYWVNITPGHLSLLFITRYWWCHVEHQLLLFIEEVTGVMSNMWSRWKVICSEIRWMIKHSSSYWPFRIISGTADLWKVEL